MDFHKICRTCLGEITDSSRSLFNLQLINEEHLKLSEILTACTSIEIVENDNLPKQVCMQCVNKILDTFKFQEQCHKSNSLLRSISSAILVQSELTGLKPLDNIEEVSLKSSIQESSISSNEPFKQERGNNLVAGIEHLDSPLNKAIKIESDTEEIFRDDNNCLATTGKNLENDYINFSEDEIHHENNLSSSYDTNPSHSQHIELSQSSMSSKNTSKQEPGTNLDEPSVEILKEDDDCFVNTVSSLENVEENFRGLGNIKSATHCSEEDCYENSSENSLLPNYHSEHIELKPNNILSKHTFKPDQLNNLDESQKALLTSVKILKEDIDSGDEGHFKFISCNFNENYEDDISNKYHSQDQQINPNDSPEEGKQLFTCEAKGCMACFTTLDTFKEHSKKHQSEEKPHLCIVCGRGFARLCGRRSLITHMKIHTGAMNFVCRICKKCFITARQLTAHKRSHTDERDYVCEICHKDFTQKCSLKKHMLIHTDERNYVCDICQKAFMVKGALKKHMSIHSGARNYICKVCNKGFNQKCILKVHIRRHTGEKPYKCNICNKSFSYSGARWKHMKTHKTKGKLEADEK